MDVCRLCALRERNGMGPCGECRAKAEKAADKRARIASAEPAAAENFDPQDVLETSLRQARAIQRRIQDEINSGADAADLVKLHSFMSKAIGQLVPTWQKLTEADLKKLEEMTPGEMESAFVAWFAGLPEPKQRDLHQRLARAMNEGAA